MRKRYCSGTMLIKYIAGRSQHNIMYMTFLEVLLKECLKMGE